MIKLDIAKAYEKLSWKYINKMLKAYGFCPQWVEWVMGMVTSPFFNILLNGSPSRVFQAYRGIRQGDLLSPFLFILIAKGLIFLIQNQARNGDLRGLKVHAGMDPQTHQKFINDTILMGHPSVQEAQSFKNSLNLFSMALSLAINPNKS